MKASSNHIKGISEKDIVHACMENDRYYQELLYKHYFEKMMMMCLRYTRDTDRAVMIVNDGFLKVFKKIHLFQFKGSLEGWIRKLVFHAISDHFKKENKYLKFLVFDEVEKGGSADALSDIYFDELVELTRQLPAKTQHVFKLYALEGYTHKEIGLELDISIGTSKWHLSEARKKLKALIYKQNNILTKHG